MVKITAARPMGGFRVELQFDNGESGIADLSDLIHRYDAAAPLRDPVEFARFRLDEWPTLVWDCGFDVAPETLYARATGTAPPWRPASRESSGQAAA
jgi:hypothetical protein